jgi:hypothetical protein
MAMGFTEPLTEMSTRSIQIMFLESRARPVRRAGNLNAICEPTVYTVWDPEHLTACYGDSFTFSLTDQSSWEADGH